MTSGAPSALLDTSVVIAVFQESARFTFAAFDHLVVSSLTIAELRAGIAMAQSAGAARLRMAALERTHATFGDGIPFDDRAAAAYGRIVDRVQQRGGSPKANRTDRMIAATAAAGGFTLVTLNLADVRGLDGIVRVVAPEPA